MTVELSALVALIGVSLSIASFFIGRQSSAKKSGESAGEMRSTLAHMASDIRDIKQELRSQREQNADVRQQVAGIKRDVKTTFNRLDELRGDVARMNGYHINQ